MICVEGCVVVGWVICVEGCVVVGWVIYEEFVVVYTCGKHVLYVCCSECSDAICLT